MRSIMLYDGNCGFCKRWIERFRHMTGDRVEYAASQVVGDRYPQISEKQFEESVWLIEPDGKISGGAEAVFRAIATSRLWRWLVFLYQYFPGFSFVSERVYRWVARHRSTACHL